MSTIIENYQEIKSTLPENVQLVAVSKTHPVESIKQLYDAGQKIFGENKVQELLEKQELLPKDIQWHLIGHLQSNKVKFVVPFVDSIQSVDSKKILIQINKEAEKISRMIKILLQVKIASEESKYGLSPEEAEELFTEINLKNYPFVKFSGLMGMATFTEDESVLQKEFSTLKNLFQKLDLDPDVHLLSMGMSGDYKTAIRSGANSVRVGSAIFGTRN